MRLRLSVQQWISMTGEELAMEFRAWKRAPLSALYELEPTPRITHPRERDPWIAEIQPPTSTLEDPKDLTAPSEAMAAQLFPLKATEKKRDDASSGELSSGCKDRPVGGGPGYRKGDERSLRGSIFAADRQRRATSTQLRAAEKGTHSAFSSKA